MYLFSRARFPIIWTVVTIWFSALILVNTTVYLRRFPEPVFLIEKGGLADWPLWRTAFQFHVFGACICLATGPLLMIPRLLRVPRLHAIMGYAYFNVVLWIAAPAGLLLAPFAKGGFPSALGFLVTGLAWWLCTWLGYRAIRQRDIASHIRWVVRSYALALSAVAFRIIQYALDVVGLHHSTTYILSVWLSLAVSVWISESCIATSRKSHTAPTCFAVRYKHEAQANEWVAPRLTRLRLVSLVQSSDPKGRCRTRFARNRSTR